MHKKNHPLSLSRSIQNKKGQMAVFIVLIFQILFVLFAMVINIGLIVHDKINLQNSVDLAAYYAAQRQAELLNGIAHQNYQIRQAWKLLSWRYFVLGTSSLLDKEQESYVHPAHPSVTTPRSDSCFQSFADYPSGIGTQSTRKCRKLPVICMFDLFPWEIGVAKKQTLCKGLELTIEKLSSGGVVTSWLGLSGQVETQIGQLNTQIVQVCSNAKHLQLIFATSLLAAFDREQSYRLKMLYQMADRLKNGVDIDGNSINKGACNTFKKNLSYANYKSIEHKKCEEFFHVVNPLSHVNNSKWLVPIVINPAIIYAKFTSSGNNDTKGGCVASKQSAEILKFKDSKDAKDAFVTLFGKAPLDLDWILGKIGSNRQDFVNNFANNKKRKNPKFFVVGVEKNPWYKVYYSIATKTTPRELFWLKDVELHASAHAAPFGGRIGPWYGKTWPQAQGRSQGVLESDRVDLMLPPRSSLTGNNSTAQLKKSEILESVPNFSRFPGDKMGLFSVAALGAIKLSHPQNPKYKLHHLINNAFQGSPTAEGIVLTSKHKSTLSGWGSSAGNNSPRAKEREAITPNWFDITYYSVFPDAKQSFIKRFDTSMQPNNDTRQDMGNYGENKLDTLKERLASKAPTGLKWITDITQVLTAWVPSGPYQYKFNKKVFQKCKNWADKKVPVMGACINGGRVGYSVKLISGEFLASDNHKAGGDDVAGQLHNPWFGIINF